ncbi:TPA: hypothetical protein N0F65_005672, partial [Lagenidium giganteum]
NGERRALRLLRGLCFASTALVKKGRTCIPTTTLHFLFSVVFFFFIGLLCMAFMIGEIAGLLILYINHEVEYRKNHIAVELYLSRWKIAGELRDRAHVYLSSLWASHRGVDYQPLLDEVPPSIRTEAISLPSQIGPCVFTIYRLRTLGHPLQVSAHLLSCAHVFQWTH